MIVQHTMPLDLFWPEWLYYPEGGSPQEFWWWSEDGLNPLLLEDMKPAIQPDYYDAANGIKAYIGTDRDEFLAANVDIAIYVPIDADVLRALVY